MVRMRTLLIGAGSALGLAAVGAFTWYQLVKAGVRHVFHPGAARDEIVDIVAGLAAEARAAKEKEMLA